MDNCWSNDRDRRRTIDESSLSSVDDVMFHRCGCVGLFGMRMKGCVMG